MLELVVLIGLLVMTVGAFWKKGVAAGALIGLAFLLHLAGALTRAPADDDSLPLSLIFKGLGTLVLLVALVKFYSRRRAGATPRS